MQQPEQQAFTHTQPTILCCKCGVQIISNPAAMCVNCLKSEIDITEGIIRYGTVGRCSGCHRFLQPPNHWLKMELESRDLLALVLRKLRGLNKVHLVDASWIYTEPHSKRIKVKVTVQREVFEGTILQQSFVAEFVLAGEQCHDCSLFEAKDTWNTVVQLRQKVNHKKTLYWLEQLILKHDAHAKVSNINVIGDGIDFFFGHRSHARKFTEFIASVVPIRTVETKKLKSVDNSSGTASYRFTYFAEIIPICHFDLVCLPKKIVRSLGGVSPLCLVTKVTNKLQLIDPLTLRMIDIQPQTFWNTPFRSLLTHKYLIPFYIFDITPLGPVQGKYVLAEAQVARESDFGKNDRMYTILTHLGGFLKPGDYALGYDLEGAVFNDSDLESLKGREMPYHFLVKKHYPSRRKRNRTRHWKVKTFVEDVIPLTSDKKRAADVERDAIQFEEFLNDVEEDPELRTQVHMYVVEGADEILRRKGVKPMREDDDDDEDDDDSSDEDFPEVQLSELLQDMSLAEKRAKNLLN